MTQIKISKIYETMEYSPAPESPKLAMEWLKNHKYKFGLFINGEWTKPMSGRSFTTKYPATGEKLANIAEAGDRDVLLSVKAAKEAYISWNSLACHERDRYLYSIARQLQKHSRLFAVLETLDNGKTIRETRDIDIPLSIRHFYHHAGWAPRLQPQARQDAEGGPHRAVVPCHRRLHRHHRRI